MQAHFLSDPQGRAVLDLRAAVRPVDLSGLPNLDPAEQSAALGTWRGRMVNEHRSAQVWAALLPQAMRAALPAAILRGLPAAASDELRHAEQCASVVAALGGMPLSPLAPFEDLPAHEDVGPQEAFLRNILSVGCLSETIAVALIRAEHAEAEGGPLAGLLAQILADEVAHARLGWTCLGTLVPRLDAASKARTQAYLAVALAHQIAHELPLLPLRATPPSRNLRTAGVCEGGEARALFFATIEEAILPRLAEAGFDAQTAWSEARTLAA
jgi:hypothetical protein